MSPYILLGKKRIIRFVISVNVLTFSYGDTSEKDFCIKIILYDKLYTIK